MPGWSALGGQAQSAYTTGDVDLNDTGLGYSVRFLKVLLYTHLICFRVQVALRQDLLWG